MLVKALLSSTKAAMALPSSMSARTPRTLSRFCASAIYQVDFLSTLTDLYLLSKVNFTIWVPTSQDLDGTSFMGSRLRIEHSRDSRDARDRGRYSPPRGRYGWVQKNSINIKSLLWSLLSLIATPEQQIFDRRGNPPGRRTGYRCIVENLSSRTSWQDLKDFMRKVLLDCEGNIWSWNVMKLTPSDLHDPLCVIILIIIWIMLELSQERYHLHIFFFWNRRARSPTLTPTHRELARALSSLGAGWLRSLVWHPAN